VTVRLASAPQPLGEYRKSDEGAWMVVAINWTKLHFHIHKIDVLDHEFA